MIKHLNNALFGRINDSHEQGAQNTAEVKLPF